MQRRWTVRDSLGLWAETHARQLIFGGFIVLGIYHFCIEYGVLPPLKHLFGY